MRNILFVLLGLLATPTWAADNTVILTPGTGVTMKSKDVGAGVQAMQPVISDTSGNPVAVKAASTAAVAADISFVTQESPNSQLSVAVGATADAANAATVVGQLKQIQTNTAAAIPAGTSRIGYTSDDPCTQLTKLGAPFSITSSTQIITGTAAQKIYICAIDVVTATAQNIALVEGTGTVCATNIFGLAGGTTAATGWNFSANSGIARGSGSGTVYSPSADSNATAANVCLLLSGSGQTSGHISYVKQ